MKSQLLFAAVSLFVLVAGNPATRGGRIVGGVDNVAGQVPYAVSLRTIAPAVHFCTGAIVNNWWIITAGNCVFNRTPASIGILLGRVTQDGTGGIQRQGFRVVIHPSYNPETMNFDLGLIQTSVIITFSQNVQSIFLADTTQGIVNAKVSGWGANEQGGGETSNVLQTLDVQTMLNDDCRAQTTPWAAERITVNMICTSNRENEGFCGGSVGGPLVWNSQLIGVASWNIPCAFGWPDVYVRVSQLRSWIISVVS